jgi:hypothetical protein
LLSIIWRRYCVIAILTEKRQPRALCPAGHRP